MIKFFSENLVKQSRVYADSENKLFPKENVFDNRRSKTVRSNANTLEFTFDFQEQSFVDTVIIVPPKKGFFGFTSAVIEIDEHGDFTSPVATEALTIFENAEIAIATFPRQEARFARLILDSSLPYVELGKVFLGVENSLGPYNGVDVGWSYTNDEIVSISKNSFGQIFADKFSRQKKLNFRINTMIEEELNVVTSMTDRLGTIDPLFVLVDCKTDEEQPHRRSGYYRFTDIPEEKNRTFGLYDMSFKLDEVL